MGQQQKKTEKFNKKMEEIQHLILSQHNSTKVLEKKVYGFNLISGHSNKAGQ